VNGDIGEAVTDPRYIYQNDANVIAYRLGIVESDLKGMDVKLDRVINEYPTHSTLTLVIDPLREEIKELKAKAEAERENKIKDRQQIKYLMITAIAGPIGTLLVAIFAGNFMGS
jgi:hypothetical protein